MRDPGKSTSAVVVDTWPMIRIGVARVLETAGIAMAGETADPGEGVALARRSDARLMVFGDHSGNTADAVLAAKEVMPGLTVVVLLGQAGREDLLPLLNAGADGLLSRSIAADELLSAVGRLLAGERVVSPVLLPSLVGIVGPAGEPGSVGAQEDANAVGLTAKEREVLGRLAQGSSNDEIARALYVSGATVKTHLSHIYSKLGVSTRHEALARAVALGLLG